jgi:hypothetical protein
MKERNKGPNPLRVISQNRIKNISHNDTDERNLKSMVKRKQSKRIVRPGSLVRKQNKEKLSQLVDPHQNGAQIGRNQLGMGASDISNSFIEGKSFSNNHKKPYFIEKSQSKGKPHFGPTEQEVNEIPRKVQDLDANSKILDFQNKNISTPFIGPYPIGNNTDPAVTMRSIAESNFQVDKKLQQKKYVQELEDQIRLRDKIKTEEEVKFNKKYKGYQPETGNLRQAGLPIHSPVRQMPEEVCKSPTQSELPKDRRGLGSAPKAAAASIMSSTITSDPFGGNIPTRKKIENRIDQELESRGSIFSGRDEKSVLTQKRNLQQQHMREELLRQIEEKKQRDEIQKKKRLEQDMQDEFRIQKELEQLDKEDGSELGTLSGIAMKKAISETLNHKTSYLPELTNRKNEHPKAVEPSSNNEENKSANEQNNLETTAAFANYKGQIDKNKGDAQPPQFGTQNPFTAITSETNKIKSMIEQVDNKEDLQNQINKKMEFVNQSATSEENSIAPGPVIGNAKISELSGIVQQLLEDQRKLKSKLNERDEIIADLSKDRDTKRKNTHEKERRSRSMKPANNNKKIGSADTKSNAARRLREKYTKEKEKINAIESKISKARKRKAECKNVHSNKPNRVGGLSKKSSKSRPNSDFDPKLYKMQNADLEPLEYSKIGNIIILMK